MSGRTKSSARNLQMGVVNQGLSMILNFVGRTLFIRILGVEFLGINSLFSDILTLLSLADLGLRTSMAYSFYKPLAEQNFKKVSQLTSFYKKIYHSLALGVSFIGLSLLPFLTILVNVEEPVPYLRVYYLIFLADTVASYLFVYKTSVIEADQKNYIITRYHMVINIIKILLQMLVLVTTRLFIGYLLLQALATLLTNLLTSKKAEQLYPEIKLMHTGLEKVEKRAIFKNMSSMFLYTASTSIISGTDNILISVMFGTIWVGVYSNYNLVVNSLYNFIKIVYISVTASIGNVIVLEEKEKRHEIFQVTLTFTMMLTTFTVVCLYTLLNDLIRVWLDGSLVISPLFLMTIIANFYLRIIIKPVSSFRQASGLYVQTKYIMLIAAVINILLSVILGMIVGIEGVIIASAVARLVTHFWYEPKLLYKEFFDKSVHSYFLTIGVNLIFTLVLITVIQFVFKDFMVTSWSMLILKGAGVGILSLIAVVAFYIRTKDCQSLIKRFTVKRVILPK